MTILRTENVKMQFGGVVAVDTLNITVEENEIVALIGPNGAGKTTAFNVMSGVYQPTEGSVFFNNGREEIKINGLKPDAITKGGMARTFQNIRLFSNLTVFENVLIAQHLHIKNNFLASTFRTPSARKTERIMHEKTEELLKAQDLWQFKDEIASSLPYGLQRRLEIARALATNPKILLLDEPAAGMNPQETQELTDFIVKIKNEYNLSIFMIEHHMDLVMRISDRIYVLDFGKNIAQGTPEEIQNNPRVIQAYLGVAEEEDDE